MAKRQERNVNPKHKKVQWPKRGVHPQQTRMQISGLAAASGNGRFPQFKNHGGRVINTPQVSILFVGDWTSAANQNRANRLRQFTSDFLNSEYMNILSQYGCGTNGTVVNSVFVSSPSQDLTGSEIRNILQTAINNNQISEPTKPNADNKLSNAYLLFLDDNMAVNDDDDRVFMCEPTNDNGFGFHESFITEAGNVCAFAVVPGLTDSCLQNACRDFLTRCSVSLDLSQEQRQTQVTSHELSEMFSDAEPATGTAAWTDVDDLQPDGRPFGENGDICNGLSTTITVGSNTWTVQEMYSKVDDIKTNGATFCISGAPNPLSLST